MQRRFNRGKHARLSVHVWPLGESLRPGTTAPQSGPERKGPNRDKADPDDDIYRKESTSDQTMKEGRERAEAFRLMLPVQQGLDVNGHEGKPRQGQGARSENADYERRARRGFV